MTLDVYCLQSVKVASVPLDAGDRMCGYAVLRFTSPQRAAKQMERLRSLCILSPTCPVARPLIVHEPRVMWVPIMHAAA
jgi:hypothetical protein